jgi:hypothetical protein
MVQGGYDMLAQDMRRLAEEIAGAYEERVRSISELKAETGEKLAGFRSDLEGGNRERSETMQAELKGMRDTLQSDLGAFRSGLKQFKADLDEGERGRQAEAQAEISERTQHIADLRKDTLGRVADFEKARKEMWRRLKSDMEDLTSGLGGFREDLAGANQERVDMIRRELKEMGDRLRSEQKGFMAMLSRFKTDLDKGEKVRREEAQAELADRRRDLDAILGGTRDLLKAFGTARKEMWQGLRDQLEDFSSELDRFKTDLQAAEKTRKEDALREGDDRRAQIAALDTEGILNDFMAVRKEMWGRLKSELDAFTSGLARFKGELDRSEVERRETMGRELKEGAEELRSTLSGFVSEMSAGVADMIGELKKDRSEAMQAWTQIVSGMRRPQVDKGVAPKAEKAVVRPAEPVIEAKTMPDRLAEEEDKAVIEEATPEEAPGPEPVTESAAAFKEVAQPETPADPDAEEAWEEEDEEFPDERGELFSEVVSLLEENPNGLRMVEMAEILGLENWRSLIPIMRELMDDGEVRKEDSTYFIV